MTAPVHKPAFPSLAHQLSAEAMDRARHFARKVRETHLAAELCWPPRGRGQP